MPTYALLPSDVEAINRATGNSISSGGLRALESVTETQGGIITSIVEVSSDYTAGTDDYAIMASGTTTVALPVSSINKGRQYAIRNVGVGTVTINPNGSELIDGAATKSLTAGQPAIVVCTGTQWFTIG